MSDKSADQTIQELQENFRKQGHELSPETISSLQQKLRAEDALKAKYAAERQAQQVLTTDQSPLAPQPKELPSLRRLQAADQQTGTTPPTDAEIQSVQPHAYTERGKTERAESGPEKKDKELYLAQKRLEQGPGLEK